MVGCESIDQAKRNPAFSVPFIERYRTMQKTVTVKELLAEEADIRDSIIALFESSRKMDRRSYGSFLIKWKPLSERLDAVITKLVTLDV